MRAGYTPAGQLSIEGIGGYTQAAASLRDPESGVPEGRQHGILFEFGQSGQLFSDAWALPHYQLTYFTNKLWPGGHENFGFGDRIPQEDMLSFVNEKNVPGIGCGCTEPPHHL